MAISDPGRGLVRRLGVTAAALLAFAAASQQRAEALSLASPGTAPSAKFATDDLTTEVRHGGHGGGGGFRGGGGGGFRGGGGGVSWRRISWRWFQGRRCCVPWRRVQRRRLAIHRGGFRAAPVFRGGGMRYGYRHVYHRPHFYHRHHFHRRFYAPRYYGYPVLLWLPAPLLPRDLDLLRAAQDLPLSSVVSSPLARSLLRIPVSLLVRRVEMKQAPGGAPVFISERTLRFNPNPCLPKA